MKTQMNLREKHNHKLKYNSLKNIETIRTLTLYVHKQFITIFTTMHDCDAC
jgi:hypothetical protein